MPENEGNKGGGKSQEVDLGVQERLPISRDGRGKADSRSNLEKIRGFGRRKWEMREKAKAIVSGRDPSKDRKHRKDTFRENLARRVGTVKARDKVRV